MKKKETIGIRFKKWRLQNDWTQAQLGKKLKLSSNYLSEVENDKARLSVPTVQNLGIILDLDLNWLLTGKSK